MLDGLLALALGAGMVAAINPCGFALLPAYLSLLVIGDATGTKVYTVGYGGSDDLADRVAAVAG